MNAKYELIDTFSRRPSLSALASRTLGAALESRYPGMGIYPQRAAITSVAGSGAPTTETLIDCLRYHFATGKTPLWTSGKETLLADPSASPPVILDVDVEQLAVLIDSVSLSLAQAFMQATVDFWDRPGKDGSSPWLCLARALEQQSLSATPGAADAQAGMADRGIRVPEAENTRQAAFEKKALEILGEQLSAIHGVLSLGLADFDEIERYLARITDVSPWLEDGPSTTQGVQVSRLDQLPDWLRSASSADRLDYSRRMAALAVAASRAGGQAWDDDLPPILDYALRTLQDSLREDHPQASGVTLDDVTVHIAKVVASAVPSAGQFVAVGSVQAVTMSVATFALENLSSLPAGSIRLSVRDGGPLPDWLTPEYLKQLVVRADIGLAYPALVRRYLISDLPEADRRQALFADQLRVQLPLKALEQKIRGQGDLTQAGYRLICSLLETPGVGGGSVVRQLAWVAQPGASADQVSNMFVIGPAAPGFGPWVLYRPFARTPLREFASWLALRDAIAQDGDLQQDVLTWMTDPARQRYANGGFDQPHIVRFGLGSEFAPLEVPKPAQLDLSEVQGDVMPVLFSANAKALVDLADRQSVSNAESRWAMIRRGGWLALEAVMPFLSGSVGTALWLVQLMTAVDQVLVAERRKAGPEGVAAWNTLLLTISTILLHQGFAPHLPASARPPSVRAATLEPATAADQGAKAAGPEPLTQPAVDQTLLDFAWSSSNHRLTADQARQLDGLKVSSEAPPGMPSGEPGKEGLYQHGQQWWVQLEGAAYRVGFNEDGAYIVDPHNPLSHGPRLCRVGQAWALDLSLKLRGGGPKRSARQLAEQNAATLKQVTERNVVLERRRSAIYQAFVGWDRAVRDVPEPISDELVEEVENNLKELTAILEERQQLQQMLRPADRASEKTVATSLQGVSRRIAFFEGVLLENLVKLTRARMPELEAVAGPAVTPENVDAYLTLFENLLKAQELGVHWSSVREAFWQQLRNVPKVGLQFWRDESLEIQRTHLLTHLEWRIYRFWSLLELSFAKEWILSGQVVSELKGLRTDEALHAAFCSHSELEKPNDYTLSEQIDVLESSLREYHRATLISMCARESSPQALDAGRFERYVEELAWISDAAEKRLSDLIRESAEPPEQPSEYAPRVKQPRKRVFKTRGQRTLVGRLREGEADVPGAVVDVTQASNETVVGTYHLHEDGQWVEVQTAPPPRRMSREPVIALADLKRQASAALERVEPAVNYARRQSLRPGEPADMQDILVFKADHLTALADKLGARLAESAQGDGAEQTGQALIGDLRAAASRLLEAGRSVRIAMIKAQPPTAARLSYLAREREVDIARFEGRKNMSGSRRNDFLQEYVIRDKDQRVLWWAHFHYPGQATAADAYTAAHLKMPEQRFIGYKAQVKAAKDDKEVVSIYRSAIGKDVARRLFLELAAAGAAAQ